MTANELIDVIENLKDEKKSKLLKIVLVMNEKEMDDLNTYLFLKQFGGDYTASDNMSGRY